FVIGCEYDFHSGPFAGSNGIAAHEVIGLRIRKGNVSKTQQGCEFLNELELRDHRLGHLFPRLLVGGLQLHSPLRQALVPHHCAQLRLQMFHHQPQRFRKAENRVGRFAAGIREIRDSEKRAVNVVMTVDKQQSHCKSPMLDSGCMMLDDQGMTEEWIVRVQGREYGPADIDTLREWQREGRLLPENEARNAGTELWSTAAAIPGLFDPAAGLATAGRSPARA